MCAHWPAATTKVIAMTLVRRRGSVSRAALLFATVERRFGAAFEFAQIFAFIKANIGNYLLAFVVFLVVRMIVPFGFILLCVGVFFTGFWSLLVATYAFASAWRLAPART